MKSIICLECKSGLLEPYPFRELDPKWRKCNLCGFTERVKMDYLTIEKLLMGRDKQFPSEYTEELKKNAEELIFAVNGFLKDCKWEKILTISSGWRPVSINSQTKNAAKKSLHQTCQAVDILDDKDQTLAKHCQKYPEILRKWGLFLESPDHTKGQYTNWVHLDICKTRKDRPSRVFIP